MASPGHRILSLSIGKMRRCSQCELEAPVDKIEGRLFKKT